MHSYKPSVEALSASANELRLKIPRGGLLVEAVK